MSSQGGMCARKKADQNVARAERELARAAAREKSSNARRARIHMLCGLGGAALHWMGARSVDPYTFVQHDFERLFKSRVTAGNESCIGDVLRNAWSRISEDAEQIEEDEPYPVTEFEDEDAEYHRIRMIADLLDSQLELKTDPEILEEVLCNCTIRSGRRPGAVDISLGECIMGRYLRIEQQRMDG